MAVLLALAGARTLAGRVGGGPYVTGTDGTWEENWGLSLPPSHLAASTQSHR